MNQIHTLQIIKDKVDIQLLNLLEEKRLVKKVKHKTLPLAVYNYMPRAQYENAWNEFPIIKFCRGLVLDDSGNIVSFPIKKFHNWEELSEVTRPQSGSEIEITEKMDGSLIIVSRYNGELVFNSRGSFYSDVALAAEDLFNKIYDTSWIEDGKTYIFELIGPGNRIVVSYPKMDLIHIALLSTSTGADIARDSRFNCVPAFTFNGGIFGEELYEFFNSLDSKNKEGFVIREITSDDKPSFRMKFKFADYKQLHLTITNISSVDIWEYAKNNKPLDDILDIMPDEANEWIKKINNDLLNKYNELESEIKNIYDNVKDMNSRKSQAEYLQNFESHIKSSVFCMISDQNYSKIIWDNIKPVKEFPFHGHN